MAWGTYIKNFDEKEYFKDLLEDNSDILNDEGQLTEKQTNELSEKYWSEMEEIGMEFAALAAQDNSEKDKDVIIAQVKDIYSRYMKKYFLNKLCWEYSEYLDYQAVYFSRMTPGNIDTDDCEKVLRWVKEQLIFLACVNPANYKFIDDEESENGSSVSDAMINKIDLCLDAAQENEYHLFAYRMLNKYETENG